MASVTEELRKYITPETIQKLSAQVDANEEGTAKAVSALLPLMLGGLARNVERGGAANLSKAIERDHDGAVLDQIGDLFTGKTGMGNLASGRTLDSSGILGHLFGDRQQSVQQGISQATNLNVGQVTNLMSLLAPVVMGALGRAKKRDNLDQEQLAKLVKREQQDLETQVPETQEGSLSKWLDSNQDGKVNLSDDIAKVGMALGAAMLFGRKK